MSMLPPYTPWAKCPKCGDASNGHAVLHRPQSSFVRCRCETFDEHMCRTCRLCNANWPQRPLILAPVQS